jgi:hypothetical protein
MKVGDIVRHKLSGDKMTVNKINKTIAVCRREDVIISERFGMEIWTAICAIENLEVINEKDRQVCIVERQGDQSPNIEQLNLF